MIPNLSLRHAILAVALCVTASAIRADTPTSFVAAVLEDVPEGLAVDRHGDLYTTLLSKGQIVRLREPGRPEVVAQVLPTDTVSGATLGIDFGPDGKLYVVFVEASKRYGLINFGDPGNNECKDATVRRTGIYRIDPRTGLSQPVVTRADGWAFCFLDDIAVADNGDIYVTDMTYSGVWKVSPDGQQVSLWSPFIEHVTPRPKRALGSTGAVNPIVFDAKGNAIYVGTILNGSVVRIPILADGSAGEAETVSEGFGGLDGLELDGAGNLLVSDNGHSEVWRLHPDGYRELIADRRAGLRRNSNLAWWRGHLCAANTEFPPADGEEKSRNIVCMLVR